MSDVFMKISVVIVLFCLGHINQTDVGTPEGFKWLYDFFIKMQAIKAVIKAKTYDNPFT
jgi:hypothetical protein